MEMPYVDPSCINTGRIETVKNIKSKIWYRKDGSGRKYSSLLPSNGGTLKPLAEKYILVLFRRFGIEKTKAKRNPEDGRKISDEEY